MSSKLEAALDAASRGFRVFPLLPNSKKPAIGQWQIAATTNEEQIRRWWLQNPKYNIGLVLDDKSVLDADPRNGSDDSIGPLSETERLKDYPTLIAETASGGFHMIYQLPEGVRLKNGSNVFGKGLDLKTGNAYIVGAGSTIRGNPEYPNSNGDYNWLKDRPIHEMPPGLIAIAQQARSSQKSKSAGKRLVEEDHEAYERAIAWIRDHAPAGEQGNRDNTAFQVAAKCYDFGCGLGMTLDVLLLWNETKCEPPLELHELERIADSAGRNRQNPIGVDNPNNGTMFDKVEIEPENRKKAEPRRFDWITAAESAEIAISQRHNWLIQDVLHEGGECVLIGKPNEGKSFLVLAMLYHIAKGLQFAGKKTTQGLSIYIAAEAQGGVHSRIAALKVKYGDLNGAPFAIIAHAPDLSHGLDDAKLLIEVIREIEAHFGQKAKIIGIDTLNRVMAGGDENSSKDMGAVLNAVRYIRQQTGAASLVVHHPGWQGDHPRGHSSIFGAVDSEIIVSKGIMKVEKLRDGEKGEEIAFLLKQTTIGFTDEGDRLTSCYVETGTREEMQIPPTGAEAPVLAIAEKLEAEGKLISIRNVKTAIEAVQAAAQAEAKKSGKPENSGFSGSTTSDTIRKHLEKAEEKHLLKKTSRGQWVTVKAEKRKKAEYLVGEKAE